MKVIVVAGFMADVDADSESIAMIKGMDFADHVLLPLKGTNGIEEVITGVGDIYTPSDLRKKMRSMRAWNVLCRMFQAVIDVLRGKEKRR